jgi:hypothetical protein
MPLRVTHRVGHIVQELRTSVPLDIMGVEITPNEAERRSSTCCWPYHLRRLTGGWMPEEGGELEAGATST